MGRLGRFPDHAPHLYPPGRVRRIGSCRGNDTVLRRRAAAEKGIILTPPLCCAIMFKLLRRIQKKPDTDPVLKMLTKLLTGSQKPSNYRANERFLSGSSPAIPARIRWFSDRLFFLCSREDARIYCPRGLSRPPISVTAQSALSPSNDSNQTQNANSNANRFSPVSTNFALFLYGGFFASHTDDSAKNHHFRRPSHDRKGGILLTVTAL